MIGRGGGKGGMMQPIPSTVKEKKNEQPRDPRGCRSHRRCGETSGGDGWRWGRGGGNDATSYRRRPIKILMVSPGERERGDDIDCVARRAVGMIGEGAGRGECCSRHRRRPKKRLMGSPGEREYGNDLDRAVRRVVGMVDEGGGKGE